jgi:hypothetical protein
VQFENSCEPPQRLWPNAALPAYYAGSRGRVVQQRHDNERSQTTSSTAVSGVARYLTSLRRPFDLDRGNELPVSYEITRLL